jgi:peroxiredoxin family protein
MSKKVAVFLHSGEYDRMHQGLSIAAAAAAQGRQVHVFFFWWALQRLGEDDLDEPDFGAGREEATARFETRQAPTLRQLLGHLRELGGATLYACTGSLNVVAAEPRGMETRVDRFVGWNAILQLTEDVVDRFYL